MYERIKKLTKDLVAVSSVNGTSGERKIGDFIYNYISSFPYFQKHPDQIMAVDLKNDPLGRRNIIALLIGEKDKACRDTILLHGHIDTVAVEDFGNLKPYAFDCDKLQEKLLEIQDELEEEVREDLLSGDYMFGRGVTDMKSGDAVHITVLEEFAKHPEKLRGNIMVSFNPVEETLHRGFIEAVDTFVALKEKYDLNYLFAINNDYTCGMYPKDETRYIYTGSVGKVLPSFFIKGKETHVGQPFEGVDACRIGAELVRRINLNVDLCDGYKGEYPAPPTALQMRDLKPSYNVQTPYKVFVYFNYMVHNQGTAEILDKMVSIAQDAVKAVQEEMNRRYQDYCRKIGTAQSTLKPGIEVLTYRDLLEKASEKYEGDMDTFVREKAEQSIARGEDKRVTSEKIVEDLLKIAGLQNPAVVVFFATPHCPHNTLKDEVPEEKKLAEEILELVKEFEKESGEHFQMLHFFPSLTDSSYLKIDDDPDSIRALTENFPAQDLLYPVPYDKIRGLNMPGINYGSFGKDAHKRMERVKMSYTFGELPRLLIKTLEKYLG